jgi:23S rRNA pseudouridine2605 synthase
VYLARCGLGSRRACEQLIRDARVTVDGQPVLAMGTKVGAGAQVTVDGRRVRPARSLVYIALHKPAGYLCANADPHGRPLAGDILKPAVRERLAHVGRLDFLSTGLIFYTNDGEFTRLVSHPGSRIEKEYLVESARKIDPDFLEQYRRGIRLEGTVHRCQRYLLRSERSALITLVEGKNRELRKVFASRNLRLKRVHRVRIGNVSLRGLAPGRFRNLTEKEVRWFFGHDSAR